MAEIRKLIDILNETTAGATSSGGVAPVAQSFHETQRREPDTAQSPQVLEYGNWENSALTTSKKLKSQRRHAAKVVKSVYGEDNSPAEKQQAAIAIAKKAVKESYAHTDEAQEMDESNAFIDARMNAIKAGKDTFQVGGKTYKVTGDTSDEREAAGLTEKQGVVEDSLDESDLVLNPSGMSKLSRGFVPHDHDRTDHEVEMARSDLFQASKNAKQIFDCIRDLSEEQGLEGWVQEKIIKAADYLNTVREYLESKQLESIDGVGPSTRMFTSEGTMTCVECGGIAYGDEKLAEAQDACYNKVKSRYKVWPSAYASGALVKCRKVGAKNWGNKSKK